LPMRMSPGPLVVACRRAHSADGGVVAIA
jgi:hypothetical protein